MRYLCYLLRPKCGNGYDTPERKIANISVAWWLKIL